MGTNWQPVFNGFYESEREVRNRPCGGRSIMTDIIYGDRRFSLNTKNVHLASSLKQCIAMERGINFLV